MTYKNFIFEKDNTICFKEYWFDKCIDRYNYLTGEYEHIPFYPIHLPLFTPEEWILDGTEACREKHNELLCNIENICKSNNAMIIEHSFDKSISHIPKEELGTKVISESTFLNNIENGIIEKAYVYYGKSIIKISNIKNIDLLKKDLINFIEGANHD